jgi:segregation and condensation protein B
MDRAEFKHILEALIFASKTPLTVKQIMAILPEETPETIQAAAAELQDALSDRAFALKKVAGGYQFASKPEYSQWISKMFEEKERSRLSRAALETLAIVAFKQPISRVEISAIRGVNSDGVMKTLLDARLVTISGRDHGPGRALLFKTTPEFLHYFGINDISDLPRPREVEELLAEGEGGQLLKDLPDELLLSNAGIKSDDGARQNAAESASSEVEEITADDTAQ